MKNTIILVMLFCSTMAFSQEWTKTGDISDFNIPSNRRLLADNPKEAVRLLKKEAEIGNTRAMNALGVVYSKGMADTTDYKQAKEWFQMAADNQYPNAWLNLGMMYKDGLGGKQDFVKAYQSFSAGATLGSWGCIYFQGYMHYKGLGCEQNYEKAVQFFKSSIPQDLGSMYMLGLCYRNGYGINQNTDSARYWLKTAADAGYQWAADELQAKEPESIADGSTTTAQRVGAKNKKTTNAYHKVKHTLTQQNLEGNYIGYVIKYDWSGKRVIGKSKLSLQLSLSNNLLKGTWVEDDSITTQLSAILGDTALVFNNTAYSKHDHYNSNEPNRFEFRNASLQLAQLSDSVYLAGNIQLYSSTHGEPEKPMYIILAKAPDALHKAPQSEVYVENSPKVTESVVDAFSSIDLLVYPNPFRNSCNVSFNLEQDGMVSIKLVDVSGRVVYSKTEKLPRGKHITTLNAEVPTGSYVLQLYTNNKAERTILIKQ